MSHQVALLTDSDHPHLYEDDQPIVAAFARRGIEAFPVIWDRITPATLNFESAIIRTTWDYQYKRDHFLSTLDALENQKIRLWNPASIVRWNSTKLYLREFERQGIRIIPTTWVESDMLIDLEKKISDLGYKEVVIKPIVGAGANLTVRVKAGEGHLYQDVANEILEKLDQTQGMMIQPFISEIVTEGEWSLIFFGGEYSHSVLRKPKSGDFRVQTQYGASAKGGEPPRILIEKATEVLKISGRPALYARVDLIHRPGKSSDYYLGELEMIEPRLAFHTCPAAFDRMVDTFLQMK